MASILGTAYVAVLPETSGFASKLEGDVSKATSSIGSLTKAGVVAAAAVTAGLVTVGVASIKMAADFQSQMTQLVTGAGESQANLALVGAGIQKMAGQVGISASDLAKGMYLVESAGYHGAAGLQVLQVAAEGAKVGNADMATVADAVTSALNAYGLGADKAAAVTNDLVATVSVGKTHMEDLAGAMGTVLPIAASLHVPLSQVTAAMATMTSQGTGASQAATYLRFTLASLAAPTAGAKTEMESLGLSSEAVANTLTHQGLPAALQLLTDAVGKKFPVGSAQYVEALKVMVGGTRGMQGVLELIGPHMQTFTDNVKSITAAMNAGGTAILGWSAIQQTFNQVLDQAKAALGAAAITLGTQLLPIVAQALPPITALAGVIIGAAGPIITSLVPAFQALTAAVTPIATALGADLAKVIVALTPAFSLLTATLGTIIPPLLNLGTKILVDLLKALTPLILPIAQIGTTLINIMTPAVIRLIPPIVQAVGIMVGGLVPVLRQLVPVIEQQQPALNKMLDALIPLIPQLVLLLVDLLPLAPPLLQLAIIFSEQFVPILIAVSPLITTVARGLNAILTPAVSLLVGPLTAVANAAQNMLNTLNQIGGAVSSANHAIGGLNLPGLSAAQSFIGGISSGVSSIAGFFHAAGGPVSAGVPGIVGERGPELFIPRTSGTIIPNNQLGQISQGGGGLTVNNYIYPAAGQDEATIGGIAAANVAWDNRAARR